MCYSFPGPMSVLRLSALPFALIAAVPLTGCASGAGPASPRVMLVQDDEFTLSGTSDSIAAQRACAEGTPKHLLRILEPTKAKLTLRSTNGASPLTAGMMSLTNVESKKTICAAMKQDGSPAVLPAELPVGTYSIAVTAEQSQRYEISWEQR